MDELVLHVSRDAELALAFAVTRAIDDLEARALLAESSGDGRGLGHLSATEYRDDIAHLLVIASDLGIPARLPHPEGEALTWLDTPYMIRDGRPVELIEPSAHSAHSATTASPYPFSRSGR